jgi:hypothetical protein
MFLMLPMKCCRLSEELLLFIFRKQRNATRQNFIFVCSYQISHS